MYKNHKINCQCAVCRIKRGEPHPMPMKGKHHSKEAKEKIGKASKQKWQNMSDKERVIRAEKASQRKQSDYGKANFNYVYIRCKSSANQRGLLFDISKEDFRKLTSKKCFYCGVKPKNVTKRRNRTQYGAYLWNGLDRIDATRGYVIDNVVPCCAMCNRMRMAWSQEEFLSKIKEIYEYLDLGAK